MLLQRMFGDMQDILKDRGLPTKGKKEELVKRIVDHEKQ